MPISSARYTAAALIKNDLENWKTLGGGIDVRRLVVNWGPLLLVARGDVFFDKQQVPYLHLRSSSKALNEFG